MLFFGFLFEGIFFEKLYHHYRIYWYSDFFNVFNILLNANVYTAFSLFSLRVAVFMKFY